MSRYDYRDPGTDPLYCDGLQPDDMPDDQEDTMQFGDWFDIPEDSWCAERRPDEPPAFELSDAVCAWCGEPLPNLDWHPYCSSQCGLYAELDSVED